MNGEQVPLHMRQATAADIRPERPNPSSAWARSLQRKHKQRQKQSGGRSGKKRRHREERDMDMEEAYDDDEVLEEAYGRARRRRTDDGPGGEDVPRQMKLNSDDAKRMASMLGKDLRAIISQRKQDEDVEPLEGENYETEGAEGAEADAAMQDGGVQLSVVPTISRTVLQRRWLLKLLQCQTTLPRTLLPTQCCRIRALKGWQFNLL